MGWPVVWKCFVTCLFLKLSQQPTWPQLIHSLRWDSGISHLQTLLAALGTRCDVSYLVQMHTWCGHRSSPPIKATPLWLMSLVVPTNPHTTVCDRSTMAGFADLTMCSQHLMDSICLWAQGVVAVPP
jgi:hypothetical protein